MDIQKLVEVLFLRLAAEPNVLASVRYVAPEALEPLLAEHNVEPGSASLPEFDDCQPRLAAYRDPARVVLRATDSVVAARLGLQVGAYHQVHGLRPNDVPAA